MFNFRGNYADYLLPIVSCTGTTQNRVNPCRNNPCLGLAKIITRIAQLTLAQQRRGEGNEIITTKY